MNVQLVDIPEKKRAVLDSALMLFQNNGFHGAPMSLIAKNAGVATGTIYHYFESKDELIVELFKYINGQLRQVVLTDNNEGIAYKERFFQVWESIFNYYVQNPGVLMFLEQYLCSPYSNSTIEESERLPVIMAKFFQEGIDGGYLKAIDVKYMRVAFFGSLRTTARRYLACENQFTADDQQKVAQLIWDGIKIEGKEPA
jgi:TetR/AcrR family transcriptional repressor of multidrug resistance operon